MIQRAGALILATASLAFAQRPIQDNSFLVEEAYNQERGVVQHIQTFQHDARGRGFLYQFTQEWPVPGVRHQLSYGVGAVQDDAARAGLTDSRLNYRLQLVGDGDARVAIAPRLTAVVPTGSWKRGNGTGAMGVEGWIPVSVVIDPRLVVHGNAGLTMTPRARDADGSHATTVSTTLAASAIWLVHPRVNILLEALHANSQATSGPGRVATTGSSIVSPGVRWSYDFSSGLQIVPGIAAPFDFSEGARRRSVMLYLSFEHPFRSQR